jgi:putative membrane protein
MLRLVSVLPHVNALLNATSGVFLVLGYFFIRRRQIDSHRKCMLTAFAASTVFLLSYIVYHSLRAYYFHLGPSRFSGEGLARPFYFTVLISHTILAVLVVPFILATLSRGLRGRFPEHLRLARWTFPVWLYVSVTGVIVYTMLYQIYPGR